MRLPLRASLCPVGRTVRGRLGGPIPEWAAESDGGRRKSLTASSAPLRSCESGRQAHAGSEKHRRRHAAIGVPLRGAEPVRARRAGSRPGL